jgi:predicted outer membrane repeat protein
MGLEERLAPAVFNIANGDIAALRSAILTANANNQADTINLAAGGTYSFADAADPADGGNALPTIFTDTNNAANLLTINGNGATLTRSTAAGTPFFRFLRVAVPSGTFTAPTVAVNGVTFTNGRLDPAATQQLGGAVLLAGGNLSLTDCTFTGNQAPSGGALGANQVSTSLRLLNVTRGTFSQNAATDGAGGAIYNISSSTLTIAGSTFTGNTSTDEGGAVRVQTSSTTTTITGSTFASNRADGGNGGGAIFIQGTTNVSFTTVRDNISAVGGGGIWNQGTLNVSHSTVSGNLANESTASGGGIYVQGDFALTNSTVHNNRAGNGGGIAYALGGEVGSITHSTITDNRAYFGLARGGGISVGGSNLSIGHSVVAGNTFEPTVTNGTGPDIGIGGFGTASSQGWNFIGNGSGAALGGTTTGNQVGTPAAPLNPQLGALQNNGGPVMTRLPLTGSPLIDTGGVIIDPLPPTIPVNDQRGPGYRRLQGGRLDIGASEVQWPVQAETVAVNGGAAQRSRVTELTVAFSHPVTLPANPAAAFRLTRVGPGAPADVTFTVDLSGSTADGTVAKLLFAGALTESGSLIDGNYTLTVLSAQVTGLDGRALDGDRDGQAGGDSVTTFHRLYGDANGDRRVDNGDFFQLRSTFGRATGDPLYLAFLDANGDGRVDNADFFAFRNRFGTTLNL